MRSSRYAYALTIMTLLPVGAANAQMEGLEPALEPPAEVTLVSPVVELPVEFVNQLPTVQVTINGKGPYRFGIETGAPLVVLTPDTAEAVNLPALPDRKPDGEKLYSIAEIRAGGISFKKLAASAMKFADSKIDGILGLPAYRTLLLTIDYSNSVVRFERGALPPPNGRDLLRASKAGPFWAVAIEAGSERFNAILDTRSMGGISFTPGSESRLQFSEPPRVIGMARGAAIQPVQVKAGRLATDVKIGQYVISRPMVTLRPLPPGFPEEPILGTRVLHNFAVTLDQQNGVVRLARSDTSPIVLPEMVPQRREPAPAAGAAKEAPPVAAAPK